MRKIVAIRWSRADSGGHGCDGGRSCGKCRMCIWFGSLNGCTDLVDSESNGFVIVIIRALGEQAFKPAFPDG